MIIVRNASLDDIPAVLIMVDQTCAFHKTLDQARYDFVPEPWRRYEKWLADRSRDPQSVFLVAERPAEAEQPSLLVGFIVGSLEREIPVYNLQTYGYLHDLWVDPAYRHEGAARRLVMHAIERFKQIGAAQVRLDVAAANAPARQLFETCGFRPATVEMLLEI